MTPPKTVVPGPTDSGRLAEPVHCGLRFPRFPDFFVDPTPPLATMGRACSLKRRKTFFKKSISIACCPILRSSSGIRCHPLSLGIVQHDQETPAVPLERATHLARSPAVSDLLGRCAPPPLRSSQSPARASLRFSIRGDTVVGAQTLLSSIQCNWPLNLLSQFWGSVQGFSYSLQFDTSAGMMDKVFDMDGLKVFVDATSIMYLNGCRVDYVETLEGAGFKFENPNVKSTCGCGSSFNV